MDTFAGKMLINKKGQKEKAVTLIKNKKLIALLFCNADSKNIEQILKLLKAVYQESTNRNAKMEVIFASLDLHESAMMKFFKEQHGQWFAIPFDDNTTQELIYKYGVIVNPTLVVIRQDGEIVNNQAHIELLEIGVNVLITWTE